MDLGSIFGNRNIEWMDDASCSEIDDPDIFFPPRDKELYKPIADEAKLFCFGNDVLKACPVRTECLWYAISGDEQHGIWGGLSHRERNALIRKWQRSHRNRVTLRQYIEELDKKAKR